MTPHNEAKKGDIAKIVLMPGDPLRAKMVAEEFLDDYRLVNKVRNIYAYTGTYKGTEVTVMASGMGMASIGIYAYELFKFYDVDTIIRIGTSGGNSKDLKLFDVVLSSETYTASNYAYVTGGEDVHTSYPSKEINEKLINAAKELNTNLVVGPTASSDVFDAYAIDINHFNSTLPDNVLAVEMESFVLFYLAEKLNKKAACIMTVVDSKFTDEIATPEQREHSLHNMIKITLEAIKK